MDEIRLSIVIPTLNESENLQQLLPLLSQNVDWQETEIIIADSPQSSDHTCQFAEGMHIRYFKAKRGGRAHQMNEASRNAKGEVLYFVHADARPPDTFYQDIWSAMGAGYQLGYFAYKFDSKHPLLCINAYCTKFDGLFAGGGDQTLFIRKEVFHSLNGFSQEFCIMEDFEFIRRIRKQNIPYTIIQNRVLISARKYRLNNYWRVNFSNLVVFLMFHLGYEAETIKKMYGILLKER